jgi:predicted AAA+ superfamily ATPase
MIHRPFYLARIQAYLDKPIIKVMTGMRRVGKSTLLAQVRESLLARGIPDAQILSINKDLVAWDGVRDYRDLDRIVQERLGGQPAPRYLMVDEIQEITGWEKAINSVLAQGLADILITGSNAHLLSTELATLLTGRFVEIPVFPLDFTEFMAFRRAAQDMGDRQDLFRQFLRYGGLPDLHVLAMEDDQIFPYLNAILNTILLKDIVKRHAIRDVGHLERILAFAFDNCGNPLSARSITAFFKNQQTRITADTVLSYLAHICDAFLLFRTGRFEIKGKKHLEFMDKYYLGDLGLRHALFGYRETDIGVLLENVVFLELLRRGYQVKVGVLDQLEIDFVAERQGERLYVQVAYLLSGPETIRREFGNLEQINDNYPKLVLSLDTIGPDQRNGIRQQNLIDFLLEEQPSH